ncbi:MAG: hypothetical protein ACTSYO_07970 [Candidatus Ranarchaeia archaeon]
MSVRVFGGEEVQILTSGGEIDPNPYKVEFVKGTLVGLTNQETNAQIKIHNSRIDQVIIKKEIEMNTDTAVIDDVVVESPEFTAGDTVAETPVKAKREKKSPPQPIDFDQMVEDGLEVWSKFGLTLGDDPKVQGIEVGAHCVIEPENAEDRGYTIFNSYNGTRGKKGKQGKHYSFSEKMTAEKKRRQLEKKGYKQHAV